MVRLYDSLLTGTASNFDLTSISQAYYHLKLYLYLRSTGAVEGDFALMTFNGDSGANYNEETLYGQNTTASAGKSGGASRLAPIWSSAGGSTNAANFAGGVFDIPHYTGANRKMIYGVCGSWDDAGSPAYGTVASYMGQWASTSAITQITLTPFTGSFAAGSRVTLYGIA